MSFKDWWNKQKLWAKGGFVGLIISLVIYISSFTFPDSQFMELIWSLGPTQFCKIFKLGFGEDCAFVYLFYGWLFLIVVYGLLGILVGFIVEQIRK